VKDTPWEGEPSRVGPKDPKQDGEIRSRWTWVEPEVWTDRMLAALEEGVKGGVWFSLIDKVYAPRTLRSAWKKVRSNRGSAGVDRETVHRFDRHADDRLAKLSERLKTETYAPLPVRRVWIPKPDGRKRPLGIPTVQDRIVQTALRHVLEPIFEVEFREQSYGFRPGRGAKDALRRVDELLKADYRYVVDADLKSYFDTIPHDKLVTLVERRLADGRVLSLIRAYLKQGVLEGMREWTSDRGTPQGAVITPPTTLHNAPIGAIRKRGWIDPVHDLHALFADVHPLDQGTNNLSAGYPIGVLETLLDLIGKLLQLSDHQAKLRCLGFPLRLSLGLSLKLAQSIFGTLDPRLELLAIQQPILVRINQSSNGALDTLDHYTQIGVVFGSVPLVFLLQSTLVFTLDPSRLA
jgi:hypothetical protein